MLIDSVIMFAAGSSGGDSAAWWAVAIAAIALLVSLGLGARSNATAKRSLRLSELQEARRTPQLDLYLVESRAWPQPPTGRILGFHLTITNSTDAGNAAVRSELHVSYALDDSIATLNIRRPATKIPDGLVPMAFPARVDPGQAVAGWVFFEFESDLTGGRGVDRYDIAVRDTHDHETSLQVSIFGGGICG